MPALALNLGGQAYRRAIAGFVRRLERQGLNVILDLHWTRNGDQVALGQQKMPNADHDQLVDWADARGIGYLAWTWDAWPQCNGPTLITDYDGTPTAYGAGIRSHYLDRFGP